MWYLRFAVGSMAGYLNYFLKRMESVMKNSGTSAWLPGNVPNQLPSEMLKSLQIQSGPLFNHVVHGGKHLISLSTPNAEWQYYLSPLGREISSLNVILIRCSSLQHGYEDSCTEVRRRWENLIKASHWENNMSIDIDPKKDMTGTLSITLSVALTIKLSLGILFWLSSIFIMYYKKSF